MRKRNCKVSSEGDHEWGYWRKVEGGYGRSCECIGCDGREVVERVGVIGLRDMGIFLYDRGRYELESRGCDHVGYWEPWYVSFRGRGYERKCYVCNWWQGCDDLVVEGSGGGLNFFKFVKFLKKSLVIFIRKCKIWGI